MLYSSTPTSLPLRLMLLLVLWSTARSSAVSRLLQADLTTTSNKPVLESDKVQPPSFEALTWNEFRKA